LMLDVVLSSSIMIVLDLKATATPPTVMPRHIECSNLFVSADSAVSRRKPHAPINRRALDFLPNVKHTALERDDIRSVIA
jgi:hypothetical protein